MFKSVNKYIWVSCSAYPVHCIDLYLSQLFSDSVGIKFCYMILFLQFFGALECIYCYGRALILALLVFETVISCLLLYMYGRHICLQRSSLPVSCVFSGRKLGKASCNLQVCCVYQKYGYYNSFFRAACLGFDLWLPVWKAVAVKIPYCRLESSLYSPFRNTSF